MNDTVSTTIKHRILYCGQSSDKGVRRECLAPLPVSNGRPTITENRYLNLNKLGGLEFKTVSDEVGFTQLYLVFCFILIGGVSTMFVGLLMNGTPLYLMFVFCLILFCSGGIGIYFVTKDNLQTSQYLLPLTFNSQKKSLLVSWYEDNNPRPDLFAQSSGASVYLLIGGGIVFFAGLMMLYAAPLWPGTWGAIVIGIGLIALPVKPWIEYFLNSCKNKTETQFAEVPWEKMRIEYQEAVLTHFIGPENMRALSFTFQIPENDNKFYNMTMRVFSREEALSTFELICEYMENGAKGAEFTNAGKLKTIPNEHTVAYYKQRIAEYKQKKPLLRYAFWRLWNIITLRYFAHRYLEYVNDTLPQKNKKLPELHAWCESIPESDWASMSPELKEVNERVRALYSNGHRWEDDIVQSVIREYDDITAEKHDFEYVDDPAIENK